MSRRFVCVKTGVDIDRSASHVFSYVTTPMLWNTWHPATVAVRSVCSRPLVAGETVIELIAVAGLRAEALWTVQACAPPEFWEITTRNNYGEARITYRITPATTGCHFDRTLQFRSKGGPWRILDSSLTRWLLERQSCVALRNLKRLLDRP